MMKNIYISCELVGGLGNQFFQVATTISYCKKMNFLPVFLKINESHSAIGKRPVYWESYFNKLSTCTSSFLNDFNVYKEPGFSYSLIPLFKENTILQGYFQSADYFDLNRDLILETFSLQSSQQQELQLKYKSVLDIPDKVSIHIRRGDYLKLKKYHTVLSETNYYQKALTYFPNYTNFVIFSDDINWCKQYFKQITTPWPQRYIKNKVNQYHKHRQFHFIQDTDINEIYLMSQCQNHIIANSSFSWWGCYLSLNQGTVVAPKKWFGRKTDIDSLKSIYRPHWNVI